MDENIRAKLNKSFQDKKALDESRATASNRDAVETQQFVDHFQALRNTVLVTAAKAFRDELEQHGIETEIKNEEPSGRGDPSFRIIFRKKGQQHSTLGELIYTAEARRKLVAVRWRPHGLRDEGTEAKKDIKLSDITPESVDEMLLDIITRANAV